MNMICKDIGLLYAHPRHISLPQNLNSMIANIDYYTENFVFAERVCAEAWYAAVLNKL